VVLLSAARTWRNGRRKGLKIPWGKPCAGSSPAVRTNEISDLHLNLQLPHQHLHVAHVAKCSQAVPMSYKECWRLHATWMRHGCDMESVKNCTEYEVRAFVELCSKTATNAGAAWSASKHQPMCCSGSGTALSSTSTTTATARSSTSRRARSVVRASCRSGLVHPTAPVASDWLKIKNPAAPAVKREAEEDWRR
jgi:hypothetical protein